MIWVMYISEGVGCVGGFGYRVVVGPTSAPWTLEMSTEVLEVLKAGR